MPLNFDLDDLQYTPLSDQCPRGAFSCDVAIVDRWFREKAHDQHSLHNCRVTTVHAPGDDIPVAFYALCMKAERLHAKWTLIQSFRKGGDEHFPSLHLEWVAVRSDLQGNGIGTVIMGKVLSIFKEWVAVGAVPALTLVSLNAETTAFYTKLDFKPFGPTVMGNRMLLPAERVILAKQAIAEEGEV